MNSQTTSNNTAALAVQHVSVNYRVPDGWFRHREVPAVVDANLSLDDGEILAILGASGSGKSSLLRAIAGLESTSGGHIILHGRDVTGLPVHERSTGMVFQDGQLFPHRSVARNIAYGLEEGLSGKKLSSADRQARVRELLDLVDLAGYENRDIATLSGGQKQRVALARSLAPRPELILLDEPLSALDRSLRQYLSEELRRILKASQTTAVYVTHDHDEAFTVADRVAIMEAGRILQIGTPMELFNNPANHVVADFLGEAPLAYGTVTDALHDGKVRVTVGETSAVVDAKEATVGERIALRIGARVIRAPKDSRDSLPHLENQ